MNKYTFARDSFTVNGKTFPVQYHISPAGTVFLFVTVADGKEETVRFNADHEQYAAARAAALEADKPEQECPESIPADAAPVAEEQPEAADDPAPVQQTEQPADDPKKARGPVPEKSFIGESIEGNGWKILFDGKESRTRVFFDGKPTDAARAALEKAGFYFSAAMGSWNKKLTFKAYRAAQALSAELNALYA